MIDMVEFIIIILGSLWIFYKWFKKREVNYIFIPVILLTLQSSRWPLFLNTDVTFGLISIFTAAAITIEYCMKKKINPVYPYVVTTLGIGIYLIIKSTSS